MCLSSICGTCGPGPTECWERVFEGTMRILITGASGSLMRAVAPLLIDAGHEVRGVDNFSRYGREAPPPGIEFLEGDLTDPAVVARALDGMDGVIQAAAQIYG